MRYVKDGSIVVRVSSKSVEKESKPKKKPRGLALLGLAVLALALLAGEKRG